MQSTQVSCSIVDCAGTRRAKGLCMKHYRAQHVAATDRSCDVPDCPRAHKALGLCTMHYRRMRESGSVGESDSRWHRYKPCSMDGCESDVEARALCGMHYKRLLKYGDANTVIGARERQKRGTESTSWTNAPTYFGAHKRTRRIRGSARNYRCAGCSGPAREWSYDHNDPEEMYSPDGMAYSANPNFYVPMCFSCHRTEDRRFRRDGIAE